jgi:Inorganic pyrophosphatase
MLRVVIETPKGSRNKFAIDPDDHIFELKRVLPAGMTFPYDFGFVPSTTADDGAMQINVDPSVTGKTRWYEYAIRFLFGGLITPLAGITAKKFGPVIGGLFLAFRRSFQPAQPLIDKHEKQKKKRRKGRSVEKRQPALKPLVRRWGAWDCWSSPYQSGNLPRSTTQGWYSRVPLYLG